MWRYQSAINHSWLESPWLYVAVPKHIMIENHRLGLVLRFFQLSVVLSLFALYTSDRKWMMSETTPEGFQAYWTDAEGEGFQKQKLRDENWAFCKAPKSVEYQLQEANGIVHTYSAEGCADLMPGEEYIKGESSMYIPTYFQDQWMRQTAGENCKHLKGCCKLHADSIECEDMVWEKYGTYRDLETKSLLGEAMCQCTATRSYYVRGVTGLNISLVPSFRAEDPSTGKSYMQTTKRPTDDILVVVSSATASDAPNRVSSMLQVGGQPATSSRSSASLVAMDAMHDAAAFAPPAVGPRGLAGGSLGAAGMGGALAFPVPAVQPAEPPAQPAGPRGRPGGAAGGARRKGGRGGGAERAAIEVDSSGGFRREPSGASLAEEADWGGDEVQAIGPGDAVAPPASETAEPPRIRREGGEAAGLGQAVPPPASGGAEPPRIRREGVEATAERPAMAPPLRERRVEPPRRALFGSLLDAVTGSSGPPHEAATYFEPGEVVGMSVEDWLRHAALLGIGPMSHVTSRTDSVLDAENKVTKRNRLSSDVEYATFRMTGLELTIDMQFQNQEVHKRKDHKGLILLVKVVARPDWEEVPVVHNILPLEPMSGNAHTVKRRYHGIRIRFQSGGKFATFSMTSMLATASSFILYLQVPSMIVSFIAIYLLGVSSEFYYEAANERMALKTIACNYIARLLQAYSAFRAGKDFNRKGAKQRIEGEEGEECEDEENVDDHQDPRLCFTRDRLIQEVKGLAESEQPDFDSDISKLADMMLEEHDDDRKGFLSAEDLTQATLDTDATTLKGIGDLIDKKRNKPFFEKLFVPNMQVQDERSVLLRAKKAELVALMKARQQAEERMAKAAALREEQELEQKRLEAEQALKDEEAAAAAAAAQAEEQEQEEGPSSAEAAKDGVEVAEVPVGIGAVTTEEQEAFAPAHVNVPAAPMGISGGVARGAPPGGEPPVAPPPPTSQLGGGPPPFGAPGGAPPPFGAPGGAPPPFGAPGGPPPPFGGPQGPAPDAAA